MTDHVVIDLPGPDVGVDDTAQGDPKLSLKALILALLSDGAATIAAIHKGLRDVSASGDSRYKVAYLLALGSVFVGGLAEMLGALWVSRDTHGRVVAGKRILYASVVTLLLGMVLDVFAYVFMM